MEEGQRVTHWGWGVLEVGVGRLEGVERVEEVEEWRGWRGWRAGFGRIKLELSLIGRVRVGQAEKEGHARP